MDTNEAEDMMFAAHIAQLFGQYVSQFMEIEVATAEPPPPDDPYGWMSVAVLAVNPMDQAMKDKVSEAIVESAPPIIKDYYEVNIICTDKQVTVKMRVTPGKREEYVAGIEARALKRQQKEQDDGHRNPRQSRDNNTSED